MSFRVTWRRRAKRELADVWLNAVDRNDVTAAAHRVEVLLQREPITAGESRQGNRRLLFEGPLGVLYKVDAAAGRVIVLTVGPSLRSP